MIQVFSLVLLMFAAIIFLTAAIGIYVYRDAKLRQMNAVLWTLIAVCAPSLIGFIIYLLVRGSPVLRCPQCGASVMETCAVCPSCGARFRPVCPNCAAPVEPGWVACPVCGAALPREAGNVTAPIRQTDKALRRILGAVVAVPVLLIAAMLLGHSGFLPHDGGTAGMREVTFEEYAEERPSEGVRRRVQAWLDELPQEDRAFALQYQQPRGSRYKTVFLVYIPGAGNQSHCSFGHSFGLFGTTLDLSLERTGESGSLFCVTAYSGRQPKIKITLEGRRIPCDITDVDFDPGLPF